MKRILFVDDEQNVLDGLRRLLRPHRDEWDMLFLTEAEEALRELEKEPADVLVADMSMPEMTGAQLMQKAKEISPGTARIILSGYAELESAMRACHVSHQYLTKPCDAESLKRVLARAVSLESCLSGERLSSLIGGMDSLPAIPETYAALTEALANPEVDMTAVAHIVERDPALCVKLLQLVNSSFFGLSQDVSGVEQAVKMLGTRMVQNLALSVEAFQPKPGETVDGELLRRLQRHGSLTGALARKIARRGREAEDAFMAGMLHDVGLLVMALRLPEALGEATAAAAGSGRPLHEAEEEGSGVTHAEIGAYLLSLWGLPYPLVECAAHHHRPSRTASGEFDLLGAVHVANVLIEQRTRVGHAGEAPCAELDAEYLEAVGASERVSEWEALADEVAESGDEF